MASGPMLKYNTIFVQKKYVVPFHLTSAVVINEAIPTSVSFVVT